MRREGENGSIKSHSWANSRSKSSQTFNFSPTPYDSDRTYATHKCYRGLLRSMDQEGLAYFLLFVFKCTRVWVYVCGNAVPMETSRGSWMPWSWSYRWLQDTQQECWGQPWTYRRVVRALYCWTISSDLSLHLKYGFLFFFIHKRNIWFLESLKCLRRELKRLFNNT